MCTGLLDTPGDQPASDPTGNTFLFLEGEIFNATELQAHTNGVARFSLAGLLLNLFLDRGPEFVSLLNGEFNLVIYQKAEKRLIVLNDHLASKPMYYLEQGHNLFFGSEKKSILAVISETPEIDPIGLLQVFAHQHNVGGRTFIKGLKFLPPATKLEYCAGQLRLKRYSLLTFNTRANSRPPSSLIEEWGDQLRQAIERRLRGKNRLLISLSAGLDSRAVACAIPRDLRPIWARTRGSETSREVIYAPEIARRLDFEHFCENPLATLLSDILPKVVWRTECAVNFTNCLTISNHARMKEHSDFLIGGWLGDASSGAHISPFMFLPATHEIFLDRVYRWYRTYAQSDLRDVFNGDFLRKHFPHLKDAFFDSFEPLAGESHIQIFEVWDLYERQSRMTLSAAPVDNYLFEHIRPMVDKDYLGFVLSLPTHLRFGQVLYQAMIYYLGPEIRDIPHSSSNLPLCSTVMGNLCNRGIALAMEGSNKMMKRLRLSSFSKLERAALGNIASVTRRDTALRQIIEDFVHADYFDPAIFNRPGILSMLDRHYRGTANHGHLITILATFAQGLPYFVYRRPRRCPPEAEPLG